MITKIQKLSAIHNWSLSCENCISVVYDYKDTKIVSNSQLCRLLNLNAFCCLWLQRYKNCQQFTTFRFFGKNWNQLFMITKIQKLSAIHNRLSPARCLRIVVYDYKDTKIVSNSQHKRRTKQIKKSCLWLQRYKNCQQFTTTYHKK